MGASMHLITLAALFLLCAIAPSTCLASSSKWPRQDSELSEEEAAADARARPWLATLEGCLIHNPECVRFPKEEHTGYFLDDDEDSASNETRCLQRASEVHAWCGNTMTNRTASVYLSSTAMEVYPPFGCAVYQRGCPAVEGTELEGVFFDDYSDSFMNETRCLQRAVDFRVYCHPPESPEAVAAFYAPTARHFAVHLMEGDDKAKEKDGDEGEEEQDSTANKALTSASKEDKGGNDGGDDSGEEEEDTSRKEVHLGTQARALWGQSRRGPSFAFTAVPMALFELAGEYLDCRSPPLPPPPPSSSNSGSSKDVTAAGRYHCNGPHAVLAVEALSLYLAVVPDHADAHYNRGVAFYTLTDLDNAVACFVDCLKLDPQHSIAMGALATVLTQQGRFDHAWGLLDSRIRPKLPPPDVIAAASAVSFGAMRTSSAASGAGAGAGGHGAGAASGAGADASGAAVSKVEEELDVVAVSDSSDHQSSTPKKKKKKKLGEIISLFGFGKNKKKKENEEAEQVAASSAAALASSFQGTTTAAAAVLSGGGGAAVVVKVPDGVSAPELVAWARLAPRFGQTKAAIALLRGFLAALLDDDDDDVGVDDGAVDGDDEDTAGLLSSSSVEVEAGLDGEDKEVVRGDAATTTTTTPTKNKWDRMRISGLNRDDNDDTKSETNDKSNKRSPALVEDRMVASSQAGFDVRKHLEASMRFRLAWLLDTLLVTQQQTTTTTTTTTTVEVGQLSTTTTAAAAAASTSTATKALSFEAWRELSSANGIVAQLARDADETAANAANAIAAGMSTSTSTTTGSGAVLGAQAAAAQAPNPVGISSSASLAQTAALRMAFCRKCVRFDIPSANAWKSDSSSSGGDGGDASSSSSSSSLSSSSSSTTNKNRSPAVRPVFVVGLPRSGTSLIEQMLGQHPLIAMAGEVPNLAMLTPKIFVERTAHDKRMTSATFDPSVTEENMNEIASRFMLELAAHADLSLPTTSTTNDKNEKKKNKEPLLLVSKLPNHFELLGFIVKLFPGVKIIHATRDIRDTLLSNYQMHYQAGHRWSYNLTEASEYAAGYRAIMRHWVDDVFNPDVVDQLDDDDDDDDGDGGNSGQLARGLPPGGELNMMEIRYEDLVCDPTSIARTLASFVGVDFVEAMAAPHASGRTTQTASNEQVRRPVYTSSVGRWKAYDASDQGGEDVDGLDEDEEDADDEDDDEDEDEDEEDLEALGLRLGGFPGDAILKRVMAFEPHPTHPTTLRELVRDLPCSPRGGASSASSSSSSFTSAAESTTAELIAREDARWPGGTSGAFQRA